jgi:RimJ/RimL family protein N-acetyltransferase
METKRLLLRPLRAVDRTWFVQLHAQAGGSPGSAERELDEAIEHELVHGFGHLVVETRAGGACVGIVELHRAGDGLVGISPEEVEIGWVVLEEHRGQGYATEAAAAVAHYALGELELDHLVAYVRQENLASLRVVEKLGMLRRGEGRSRSGAVVEVFELGL